ncbi:hypothetical protein DFJ73DRAFT_547442 [Zopfochytrium polystomum]|nr:hypothetical protein DFJ73DRAFT_547442 [Zopfochytrium polystomum]
MPPSRSITFSLSARKQALDSVKEAVRRWRRRRRRRRSSDTSDSASGGASVGASHGKSTHRSLDGVDVGGAPVHEPSRRPAQPIANEPASASNRSAKERKPLEKLKERISQTEGLMDDSKSTLGQEFDSHALQRAMCVEQDLVVDNHDDKHPEDELDLESEETEYNFVQPVLPVSLALPTPKPPHRGTLHAAARQSLNFHGPRTKRTPLPRWTRTAFSPTLLTRAVTRLQRARSFPSIF